MDIHKPKPWHGLREFLKEYVIIVVGVLTALGAEQIAESLHTSHVIAEAEDAMRSELVGDDLPQAYVRVAIAPCLASDLRRMREAVAERAPAETLGALTAAYNPPVRTWDRSAWTSTLSGPAGSRMNSQRLLAWSQDYVLVPMLEAAETQEVDAFNRLQHTRFRSGVWSSQRADALNDAIDDLEVANQLLTRRSAGLAIFTAKDRIALAPADRAKLLQEAREGYGTCAVEPNLGALHSALGQVLTRKDIEGVDRGFGIERK